MDNQPTLKEFLKSRHKEIVLSQDGSFHLRVRNNPRLYSAISMITVLVFLVPLFVLDMMHLSWINFVIDTLVIWGLLMRFISILEYKNSSFELIDENNEDYQKSIKWLRKYSKCSRIVFKVFVLSLVMLSVFASFTTLYIRSLIENKTSIDLLISFSNLEPDKGFVFQNCENLSELTIPTDSMGNTIYINADLSGKPDHYRFELNGHTLYETNSSNTFSYIWDNEIFRPHYSASLGIDDLPDNSVLEISSGSFSRQWTIKTE